ncbi:hypothetical protein BJX70DRAFT_94704 [Aspergillus crustosus]
MPLSLSTLIYFNIFCRPKPGPSSTSQPTAHAVASVRHPQRCSKSARKQARIKLTLIIAHFAYLLNLLKFHKAQRLHFLPHCHRRYDADRLRHQQLQPIIRCFSLQRVSIHIHSIAWSPLPCERSNTIRSAELSLMDGVEERMGRGNIGQHG